MRCSGAAQADLTENRTIARLRTVLAYGLLVPLA